MASLGDRRIQQPVIDGQQWPSTGHLPLSDRLAGEIRLTFQADAVVYNPTPVHSFSANAVLRAKIVDDDFNRTVLDGSIGSGSKGHYSVTSGNPEYGGLVNGTLDAGAGEEEVSINVGPATHHTDVYFDFKAVSDAYYYYENAPFKIVNADAMATLVIREYLGVWYVRTNNAEYSPALTFGNWYRVRFYSNAEQNFAKVKVWDRNDPEPATWNLTDVLSQFLFGLSANINSYLYAGWDSFGTGVDNREIDNFEVWALNDAHTVDFLTADASLLKITTVSFTADAWIAEVGGANTYTFSADAVIIPYTLAHPFTANAIIKTPVSRTFTANARLTTLRSATFTSNAWFTGVNTSSFIARAVLYRPPVIIPSGGPPSIVKRVSMSILQHRERPLPTFVPPRIPDQKDEMGDDPLGGPNCLSPCPGAGAGYGTGYGANGGAIVQTITQCNNVSCGVNYHSSGDGWLGKGALGFSTHCGCTTSHSYSSHINRMWITYTNVPTVRFRMRAKLVWDVGAPPNVTVNIYAGAQAPSLQLGECDTSASYWNSGLLVGHMTFSSDGTGSIGERNVYFQNLPSELVIDPGAISGGTFRFELQDEAQFYRAEFKASTTQIVTD